MQRPPILRTITTYRTRVANEYSQDEACRIRPQCLVVHSRLGLRDSHPLDDRRYVQGAIVQMMGIRGILT